MLTPQVSLNAGRGANSSATQCEELDERTEDNLGTQAPPPLRAGWTGFVTALAKSHAPVFRLTA